jgi:hypothetical protein
MHSEPLPKPTFHSESHREAKPKFDGPGRPRVLNDRKRAVICDLIAMGSGLRQAAEYVGCSVNTVRREAERDPNFREEIRCSLANAELNPLRAMQRAIRTHWRAAAWFLERAFPDRFARPEAGAFAARELRQLLNEVMKVIHTEISSTDERKRIEVPVRDIFQQHVRRAADRHRAARRIRLEINTAEEKNRPNEPLATFDPSAIMGDVLNPRGIRSVDQLAAPPTESACITQSSQPGSGQTGIRPAGNDAISSNIL